MWAPDPYNADELADIFHQVRMAAHVEQLVPLEVHDIRQAARRMKARAGQGIDQISPVDVD